MYPKAKYHPTQPHRVVHSENEEKELGNEWFDSPNFTAPAQEEKPAASGFDSEKNFSGDPDLGDKEDDSSLDSPRRGRPPKHK